MRLLSSRIARLQSKPKPHYQQENRFRALLSFIASYDKRATKVMNAEACKAVRQQLGRSRTDSRLTRPMQLQCNPICCSAFKMRADSSQPNLLGPIGPSLIGTPIGH